jgi:hypothetical protein
MGDWALDSYETPLETGVQPTLDHMPEEALENVTN